MTMERMSDRFESKVVVVTGGGAGIGRALCRRFAAEGATVAVLDIQLEAAQDTVDELGGGVALSVDVSDSAAVDAAMEQVRHELGAIDVLVNNAGAVSRDHVERVTPLLQRQRAEAAATGRAETPLNALVGLTDEQWRRMLAIHLDGTFFCTRAAVRAMTVRGAGAIVNMASVCGLEGCTGHPHYSAAKAGILGFTKAVGKELIVQGIRVNVIAPGFVGTDTGGSDLDEHRRATLATTPAGRLATPDEIAATAAFLASDEASYYVGATFSPNGGLVTAV